MLKKNCEKGLKIIFGESVKERVKVKIEISWLWT